MQQINETALAEIHCLHGVASSTIEAFKNFQK